MKGRLFMMLTFLLFVSASCKPHDTSENLEFDDSVKQIVFFSDESQYQHEAAYYDAIIELKKDFPEEIKNMMIFSPTKAKEYYDTFKVKNCPAILVIYKDKVVVKVDDANSKEQIVKPISIALTKDY